MFTKQSINLVAVGCSRDICICSQINQLEVLVRIPLSSSLTSRTYFCSRVFCWSHCSLRDLGVKPTINFNISIIANLTPTMKHKKGNITNYKYFEILQASLLFPIDALEFRLFHSKVSETESSALRLVKRGNSV